MTESAELFVNCLEALVKFCPPIEECQLANRSKDASSQKFRRMVTDAGHGSNNISKPSKPTTYGNDRMNVRTFSEDTADTRGTAFIRRE